MSIASNSAVNVSGEVISMLLYARPAVAALVQGDHSGCSSSSSDRSIKSSAAVGRHAHHLPHDSSSSQSEFRRLRCDSDSRASTDFARRASTLIRSVPSSSPSEHSQSPPLTTQLQPSTHSPHPASTRQDNVNDNYSESECECECECESGDESDDVVDVYRDQSGLRLLSSRNRPGLDPDAELLKYLMSPGTVSKMSGRFNAASENALDEIGTSVSDSVSDSDLCFAGEVNCDELEMETEMDLYLSLDDDLHSASLKSRSILTVVTH